MRMPGPIGPELTAPCGSEVWTVSAQAAQGLEDPPLTTERNLGPFTSASESRCATCWSLRPEESPHPDPLLESSLLEAKCNGQMPPSANSKIPLIDSHPRGRGSQGASPPAGLEAQAGQIRYLHQDLKSSCSDEKLECITPTEGVLEKLQSASHQLDSQGLPQVSEDPRPSKEFPFSLRESGVASVAYNHST